MTSEKPLRALAIDPGERVGWAHGLSHPLGVVHPRPRAGVDRWDVGPRLEVTGQGVSALKDFALKLGQVIGNYDVVIYETWRLYPAAAKTMIGNDMQPSQLVGIIRYLAWIHPQVKLVTQGANIKKTALKTMPEAISARFEHSSEQHDQDALMHLWHWHWTRNVNSH